MAPPTRAHLGSLQHRLEDVQRELLLAADGLQSDGREDLAKELAELERAVAVTGRRLRRITKALP